MDTIGIDLHKRESQLGTITPAGELLEARIATSHERFTQALGRRPPARILLEASTEREWVARHLEGLGHTVIAYREIHRVSDARRHLRAQLAVRDALVRTRTRFIAISKAAVRREGLRLPSGEAAHDRQARGAPAAAARAGRTRTACRGVGAAR